MREKLKWLEKYAPPGMKVMTGVGVYIGCVVAVTFQIFLSFLYPYGVARSEMFTYNTGKEQVIEGMMMPEFEWFTENIFIFAEIMCVVTLLMTIYNYMYHYQDSMLMYLMRRLPDKWEVHRRCFALPVAGTVFMVIWTFMLYKLCYAIYILYTPSQCLPLSV